MTEHLLNKSHNYDCLETLLIHWEFEIICGAPVVNLVMSVEFIYERALK